MAIFKWRLEITNWKDIDAGKYGGDIYLNTYIEKFATLDDVWNYLGFKLKKMRFGYAGLKDDIEYKLIREV